MDVPRIKPKRRQWWLALAIIVAVACTAALTSLKAAAPSIDRQSVWLGKVQRGEMVREARGAGTLVPEDIRWLTSVVPARVERVLLKPGAPVRPDSVIIELSNPDLRLAALDAEQQLASARADSVRLSAEKTGQSLAQQSTLATLQSEQRDAERRAQADQALASQGYLSKLELEQTKGRAAELAGRLRFEAERLTSLDKGKTAQLTAQRAQVERLQAIAQLRHQQVAELSVSAIVDGVLQELGVQVGQWVTPGTVLAKVAQPSRLKAEVKLPELSARDVAIGQFAWVDTQSAKLKAHVGRVDPAVNGGTVKVDLILDEPLPPGARVEQSVEGIVVIERLPNVLFVDRPANAQPQSQMALYRVQAGELLRVDTRLGRSSAKTIEIASGLDAGDQIVLSDMSAWSKHDRLRFP